jgi:hypothetical protein
MPVEVVAARAVAACGAGTVEAVAAPPRPVPDDVPVAPATVRSRLAPVAPPTTDPSRASPVKVAPAAATAPLRPALIEAAALAPSRPAPLEAAFAPDPSRPAPLEAAFAPDPSRPAPLEIAFAPDPSRLAPVEAVPAGGAAVLRKAAAESPSREARVKTGAGDPPIEAALDDPSGEVRFGSAAGDPPRETPARPAAAGLSAVPPIRPGPLVPSTRAGAPASEAPNKTSGSSNSPDPDADDVNVGTSAESGRASGTTGADGPSGPKSSSAPCESKSSSDSIDLCTAEAAADAGGATVEEMRPEGDPVGADPIASSTGRSAKGSKAGREAASIVFEPESRQSILNVSCNAAAEVPRRWLTERERQPGVVTRVTLYRSCLTIFSLQKRPA